MDMVGSYWVDREAYVWKVIEEGLTKVTIVDILRLDKKVISKRRLKRNYKPHKEIKVWNCKSRRYERV